MLEKIKKIPSPIVALTLLLIAYVLKFIVPAFDKIIFSSFPLAVTTVAFGSLVSGWALFLFIKAKTDLNPAGKPSKLVTEGPFNVSRNPMYLGAFIILLGVAFYMGTLSFYLVPLAYFFITNYLLIPYEEGKLERIFGDTYLSYKKRARRWI